MVLGKNNEKIKQISKLMASAKERKEKGLIVLEGERLVSEAQTIEELYYTSGAPAEQFLSKAKAVYEISNDIMKKISDTVTPQGILAVVKRPNTKLTTNKNEKYLAFENVNDPSNLGAAARTAEALGFKGIIVKGVDPFSPKVLRASMGGILRLEIIEPENILEYLKNDSHKIIGTVVSGGKNIKDFKFGNDILLIGNEANGLTENAVNICDDVVTIEMAGKAESLNAAAAAAISMWEMTR